MEKIAPFVTHIAAVGVLALMFAGAAQACNAHPSLVGMEGQIMCPVCGTTLDQSDSPAAQQIKRIIARRIAAGDSDCMIKDLLVAQYHEAILAAPPKNGLGLLAWWLPIGATILAAAILGVGAWRWSCTPEPKAPSDLNPTADGRSPLDPTLELHIDE